MRFLDLVHKYEKRIDDINIALNRKPDEWPKFQSEINESITRVFELCLNFEQKNSNDESKIYKMKRMFQDHFGHYFKIGKYTKWVCDKPMGYAGDYQIIDWIYKNSSDTTGIERCSDNYFLQTGAAVATRNRKEDFKKLLINEISLKNRPIEIMDLASGPCRDIVELYQITSGAEFYITCVDHDINAINYAQELISNTIDSKGQIDFIQKNVVKIALARDVGTIFQKRYDVIFSTGLFDYLNDKLSVRLVVSLKKLLKKEGILIISNYRDKLSNPSRLYMEWGGNWELIYRSEDEFLNIFKQAGFESKSLNILFEQQKIMQYCIAKVS